MDPPSRLISYLEHRTGLGFAGAQRSRMLAVLDGFVAGHGDEDGCVALLDRDPFAFSELAGALTVPETHFFRDGRQIALLQRDVLPAAARARGPERPIDVWSAGCASGEEPYSVAMAAAEVGLGNRLRVLGTDLSWEALDTARAGVFGTWSLRGVGEPRRRRWFERRGPAYRVRDAIRRRVRFRPMNLLEHSPGRFDIVLCRNVFLYFTDDAAHRATGVLLAGLRPGGWLLTGASDPPLHLDGLERVRTDNGPVYRRATEDPPARRAVPADQTVPDHVRPVGPTPTPRRPSAAGRQAEAEPPSGRGREAALRVRSLGGAGRRDEALALAEVALAADPLDPELWYLASVLHLEAGRTGDAAAAARSALFLAPDMQGAGAVLHHARSLKPDAGQRPGGSR